MNEVVSQLYIGSVEDANDTAALENCGIKFVISLGCNISLDSTISHLSFPDISDSPETCILGILSKTDHYIASSLESSVGNILIHCVYGQSRSAAVIVSYLMSRGTSLQDSINVLKSVRPCICINPGFLSQLYLLSKKFQYDIEYFLSIFNETFPDDMFVCGLSVSKYMYCCNSCDNSLVTDSEILTQFLDANLFLEGNIDEFWRNYIPIHYKKDTIVKKIPIPGYHVVGPLPWIVKSIKKQISLTNETLPENGLLHCPHCNNFCGSWYKRGILLCNHFLCCYLFSLNKNNLIRKKKGKRKLISEI